MNDYTNIDEVSELALSSLEENGIFLLEDFLDPNICDNISKDIISTISSVDKNTTKEYEDYIVLDPNDPNRGSNWMDAQSKTVINFRGNHGSVVYDTGFCDIFNPHYLFEGIGSLNNHPLFEKISRAYGKNPANNYSNIYYNDGITDTRGWHKDARMIKLFLYLTDVLTEDYGPYSYLPGSHKSPHNVRDIKEWPHDENQRMKILAPKGTLIGSYQHGFHRGIPQQEGKKRAMFVYKIYL